MSEIRLVDISRRFGALEAVAGVNLVAPSQRVTALLGASGSGKSTLLRLIAGLEAPDGGEILFDGVRFSARTLVTPPEQRRVGLVFQDFALFPHMTALGNVGFGLAQLPAPARKAAALGWLERVGLEEKAASFPHELSGGEQQRVALARALAPRPRAVLLDEPFSGLDPTLRTELRDVTLTALREIGATAVFVTHDAAEALYVADEVAIMQNGRLLQSGPPRDVYARPASLDAAAALGPINVFRGAVISGLVQTPFGAVPASGLPDGPIVLAVRAEGVDLVAGQSVRVVNRRPQGPMDVVELDAGGVHWRALAPRDGPNAGERCDVRLRADAVHLFPQ